VSDHLPQPLCEDIDLGAVLHALSDPVRRRIVRELAEEGGERICRSFEFGLHKSTMTHHFRILRQAGLIGQRHQRTTRPCWLRVDDLERRFPGLLDALMRATETDAPAAPPLSGQRKSSAAR
jgi:DNA-binding transcriptional ArsR family regulator